mgnify:CR=1 FL=1|tara:strand:+ start:5891 stop:7675 length:1785 start_codon:yes stop_codon:yes gene_type:complete
MWLGKKVAKSYFLPVRIGKQHIPRNSNIRLLGTWVLDQEDLANAKKVDVLDYCYDDYKVLYHDFLYIKELYTKILPIVGNLLNDYHSINWNSRSFKIFYGMWLHDYLPVLRERYQTVDSAIKRYPSHSFILTSDIIQTQTSTDFKKKITEDDYNHYLYTSIVKFISRDIYRDSYFLPKDEKETYQHSFFSKWFKFGLQNFLLKSVQTLINAVTKNSSAVIDRSYFSVPDFARLILRKFPQITPIIYFPKLSFDNVQQELSVRRDLACKFKKEYCPENKFEEFLVENLIYDLPMCFVEGFNRCLKESGRTIFKNKNYLSSNAVLSNQMIQFSVANQMTSLDKLIIAQHGGSYGIAQWSSQQFWELDTADIFISFGWSAGENSNISAISHPKLIPPIQKGIVNNGKILYVTNGSSRYFNRNWSHPTAGNSFLNYYENMLEFIQTLDPLVTRKVRLRLSPSNGEYGLGVETYLNGRVPFSNGNFYDELQHAALVICDHNQTSFLESLSNNKPTIIFWNDEYTKISEDAFPYFEELAKEGVFYTSPKKAANCLNDLVLNSNISDWWMDSSRQAAVTSFVQRYAKVNREWVDEYCSVVM